MGLFTMRKPRGFNHKYMYVDPRKDRLKAIENRAKAELGMAGDEGTGHERIRGMFMDATRHARRRRGRKLAGGFVLSYGVIVALLILLFIIWKVLLTL